MKVNIKEQFRKGEITKPAFIDAMYQQHQELFEYCNLLQQTDLGKIEITADGILFTSKEDQIKFYCTKADKRTAPFEIMNFEAYETEDAGLLYQVIKDSKFIFDIGANIGWYSIGLAKKQPQATIYSFEPLLQTYSSLEKNVALNEMQNIVLHNFGFSKENTTLKFYTSPHTSVSNSAENISGEADIIETVCEVKRMDDYVKANNLTIDVIKCDVEGAELFVFEGGLQTISEQQPIIFCEMLRKWAAKFNYHPNDIIQLLATAGYQCFVNNGKDQLAILKEVTPETTQTNYFFLHPNKHQSIIQQYGA
ncbi:MAG: hypothetical protein RLY16_2968 [Bacteroidota bacterium]